MARYTVTQIRSGEGWILTDARNAGAEVLASDLQDVLGPVLLVASEEFDSAPPQGGEQVDGRLYALRGEAALAMLRDWPRWGRKRALFASVRAVPDADARRRWIPDPMRPWDVERLQASVYGQLGGDWAQRGLWFASERDRARLIELSVARMLAGHGVGRLPNGDVTLVLEMPTDSSFEASFAVSGSGDGFAIQREFPSRMVSRRWSVVRGDWVATEAHLSRPSDWNLRRRLGQGLVTAAIVVVSLPMLAMVVLVAVITKLTGGSTGVSPSSERVVRRTR